MCFWTFLPLFAFFAFVVYFDICILQNTSSLRLSERSSEVKYWYSKSKCWSLGLFYATQKTGHVTVTLHELAFMRGLPSLGKHLFQIYVQLGENTNSNRRISFKGIG